MKLCKVQICSAFALILLFVETVTSTVIATTLMTGFMGGFLMGKITLGSFLAMMNSLNQQQQAAVAAAAAGKTTVAPAIVGANTRYNFNAESSAPEGLIDIPDEVETEVRDRILKQLGKMDPLNCLPLVFCEISADPKTAKNFFGLNVVGPSLDVNLPSSILSLSPKKKQTVKISSLLEPVTPKKTKKHKSKSQKKKKKKQEEDNEEDDTGNDDDAEENEESDSQSDEDEEEEEEPYDEEADKLRQYEEKENYALENKALEELVDEFDEPINYYFILKDKKKNIHPELKEMMQDTDISRRFTEISSTEINKRIGEAISNVEKKSTSDKSKSRGRGSSTIDDVFADDPFFDDFSRSLKLDSDKARLAKIGLVKRSKRDVIDDEDDITMEKYKMAAKVAETYKDPKRCRRVFNTCPFSSDEVMNMITKLNAEDKISEDADAIPTYTVKTKNNNKKINKDGGSLINLKNTLVAIEKLNDATLLAETIGEQVDYAKILEDVKEMADGDASEKIMEDFEQFEDKLKPAKKSKRKAKKSKKRNKKNKKSKKRQRRHGGTPPLSPEGFRNWMKQRIPRISAHANSDNVKTQSTFPLPSEFKIHDHSVELFETSVSTEAKPLKHSDIFDSADFSVNDNVRVPESRRVVKDEDEVEDDEVNSPEAEDTFTVPSFSQTFIETVQTPSKTKVRPRPVYNVVKVKPQFLQRSTTPKSVTAATTLKTRRTTVAPLITQHFSGELEDDEEDANLKEKAVDALVSKYKPKDKKQGNKPN